MALDFRDVTYETLRQGWRIEESKKGLRFVPPDPAPEAVQMVGHAIRRTRDQKLPGAHTEKRIPAAPKATSMTLDKFCESWMTEPMEWSVELTIEHVIPEDELVDAVDDLLEDLAPRSASASTGRGILIVRMTVTAKKPDEAYEEATHFLMRALFSTGWLMHLRTIVASEIETLAELAAGLEQPPVPEVIGVAELSEMLGVTKQRVSYLAQSQTGFPKPIAKLASGPVWLKPTVMRFVETWERRPRGRPKKTAGSAHPPLQ